MRLVHALCTDAFAGVERHIVILAAAQAAVGHEVTVIGGQPSAMRSALSGSGVAHEDATSMRAVALALRGHTLADVVHVHMTMAEVAAASIMPRRGPTLVATRHFARQRGSSPLARGVAGAAARRVASQIAVSRYVAAHVDGESVVVLPGLPDTGPPPDRTGASGARRVLIAQRLEPEKRADVALRAMAASGLAEHGWVLQVAGSGSQEADLRRLAEELGIARAVSFLGYRADIEHLMRQATVLLAPCPIEGVGLSVLEAMAVGLPVVASAAGGHLETLGLAADAMLHEPNDATSAAHLLRALAEDEPRRVAYGTELAALQRSRFSVEEQQRHTDEVYRSVS